MTKPYYAMNGPDELLSAVPVLLGFQPAHAVVAVCFKWGTNEIAVTAHTTLDQLRADQAGLARQTALAVGQRADRCVLVAYGIDTDDPDLAGFAINLSEWGVQVVDLMFTGNEPHDLHVGLHAEAIWSSPGMTIADSQEAVRALVEFSGERGLGDVPPDMLVLAAMRDIKSRDEFIAGVIRRSREMLPGILATCRVVPDDAVGAADLCTAAAIVAYRTGNGALARMALERALRINSGHRLAGMMAQIVAAGVAPEILDEFAGALGS